MYSCARISFGNELVHLQYMLRCRKAFQLSVGFNNESTQFNDALCGQRLPELVDALCLLPACAFVIMSIAMAVREHRCRASTISTWLHYIALGILRWARKPCAHSESGFRIAAQWHKTKLGVRLHFLSVDGVVN